MDKKLPKGTKCHDCKHEFADGASVHVYESQNKEYYKCDKCFGKDRKLSNFQECEVYSRIVGYIRPVKNWNVGKAEEYKDRKEFKVP